MENGLALDVGSGAYGYWAMGQNHYQAALTRIAQQHRTDSSPIQSSPLLAELAPEPTNPYDAHAVRVLIDDQVVGYVAASNTEPIHKLMQSLNDDRLQVHAYIDCAYDGAEPYEADLWLDLDISGIETMLDRAEVPDVIPPRVRERNHAIANLRDGIQSKKDLVAWMGSGFPDERRSLRREISEAHKRIEREREKAIDEAQLNRLIASAIDELEEQVAVFRSSATASDIIGLGSYRDGEEGRCYLCGGWTDSSDNRGRVSNDLPFVKPGLLFPTDDHMIPRHSVAHLEERYFNGELSPAEASEWDRVHGKSNVRTAHFSCNSRKSGTSLAALTLPLPVPNNYDEQGILEMRSRYKALRDAKQHCRDILPTSYVVCGDNAVNLERKMLKARLNRIWDFATDDFTAAEQLDRHHARSVGALT